jgi:hypothetical protein
MMRNPVAEISAIDARKSVNVSFSSTVIGMYFRRRSEPGEASSVVAAGASAGAAAPGATGGTGVG